MVVYTIESVYRVQYFVSANLLNLALPLVVLAAVASPKPPPSKPIVEQEEKDEDAKKTDWISCGVIRMQ